MSAYEDLASEKPSKQVRDWTAVWEQLEPIGTVNGPVREAIDAFCERKRITFASLEQLGTRYAARNGRVCLAFAGQAASGAITAIKFRPVDGSSHDSFAEKPSVWTRPIIAGNTGSLDWLVVEGETDSARLLGLLGETVAVLVLPAGARTFRAEWGKLIPRGATVALCHDADPEGDAGAAKAARILGGRTMRIRPPVEGTDWCDWSGGRAELLEIIAVASKAVIVEFGWASLQDIAIRPLVFIEKPFLQEAAFHLLVGIKNAGKGTWMAQLAARVTRGELGPRRHVIWVAIGEDSYAIDVRPRIEAAGGDSARVTVLEEGRLLLPDHAGELERVATENGAGLVVIDPIGGGLAAGKSTNFDADVRPALAALNQVADSTEAMVFGVRHLSIKSDKRQGGTLSAVLGSSDWINVPRAVLALVHDDADAAIRHLFVVAGNRVQGDTPGLMFRIEGHVLPGMTEEVTVARILGASSKDPDELLAFKRPRKDTKTDAARELIVDTLMNADGYRMESDNLDAEIARKTGLVARSVRNLRVEMKDDGLLRAVPDKDSEGEIKRWFVTLTGAAIQARS